MRFKYLQALGYVKQMCKNCDGVLKVDSEGGSKRACNPRSHLAQAEVAMAERGKQEVSDRRGVGTTM